MKGARIMSSTKTVKLFTAAGEPLEDAALSEDFLTAVKCGPYRVGERAFYFRSGLRRLCLPYGSFGHVFKRAMLCASRTCGKVVHTDTFWLVFCPALRAFSTSPAKASAPPSRVLGLNSA